MGVSAPALEDIIDAGIETALGTVETSQIGIVTAYNRAEHTVDVQPAMMRNVENEADEIQRIKQPIIRGVPVWYLGSGDARVTFPIAKGSNVLLVHLSHPRAPWQFSSGSGVVESDDNRRHALTDCVAIPGGLTAKMISQKAGGSSRVDANGIVFHTPGKIYLGGGTTSPVARKTDLDSIKAAFYSPAIMNAQTAYAAAVVTGIPATIAAALTALMTAVNNHFTTNPCNGSAVTESE